MREEETVVNKSIDAVRGCISADDEVSKSTQTQNAWRNEWRERAADVLRARKQIYQSYLDKVTPYVTYRWVGTAVMFILFTLRIVFAQGWYIGMPRILLHKTRTTQRCTCVMI